MNVLLEAGYLSEAKLETIKKALNRAILTPGIRKGIGKDLVINYSYTTKPAKMYHLVKYVCRATFLDKSWFDGLSEILWNFRNVWSWGNWAGDRVWETKQSQKHEPAMILQAGYCPKCGCEIHWASKANPIGRITGVIDSTWLEVWEAKEIGAVYYEIPDG